ncbi:hypothetical protein C900_00703 [Fulvivirga imtechensis AK7]|uniref:Uncharacterized protein n=1 Tax=Fulvivirga imtechensis AK7 TaxID=1237149 RepID=L8JH78_9BACT|nr:hypothetical protein C900_00703 [Fulvivirga imtechensis AK7]
MFIQNLLRSIHCTKGIIELIISLFNFGKWLEPIFLTDVKSL